MKIDKSNPGHWLCLILFGINVLGAMLWRGVRRRRADKRRQVILYGHKLNGNLLAIHQYWRAHAVDEFDMVFLTMDKIYHKQLLAEGTASVLATRPSAMHLLARADAVISDHGLHAMAPMVGRSGIKFFDVWHGIPFKGFDADDFRLQHRYDEVWVASPLLAKLYVERFGFDADKVKVTGYARTDRLVHRDEDVRAIRQRLGLDAENTGKIILFAPTWKQDAAHRSIWPFGETAETFLSAMSALAQRTGTTFAVRAHLNSGAVTMRTYPRIMWIPFAHFPDAEALLLASDVLVCDWSSIAFDWLLLDRPTFFLDVSAPFAKGFSLGAKYRYGALVPDLETLVEGITRAVIDPATYWQRYQERQLAIKKEIYGGLADGKAAERCVARMRAGLGGSRSTDGFFR